MHVEDLIKSIRILGSNDKMCDINNIALCADENYIPYAGIAVASILNTSHGAFCFHIFTNNIDCSVVEKFKYLAEEYGQNIVIYEINDNIFRKIQLSKENAHVSSASFYRFIVPDILYKDIEKILYVDVDVFCVSDINPIFSIDLGLHVSAVIADINEIINCDRVKTNRYFNAGVMLIDTKKYVDQGISKKCFELAGKINYPFLDQDILNIVLNYNALFIDSSYNFQYSLSALIDNADKPSEVPVPHNVAIIHFIGASKPWHLWVQCCKIIKLYNILKENTPWKDLKCANPNTYKTMHKAARVAKKENDVQQMFYWYIRYAVEKVRTYLNLG